LTWWRYFDRPGRGVVRFPLDVLPDFPVRIRPDERGGLRPISTDRRGERRTAAGPSRGVADAVDPDLRNGWERRRCARLPGPGRSPIPVRMVRPDTIYGPDHASGDPSFTR
jgi:hypothetical protein